MTDQAQAPGRVVASAPTQASDEPLRTEIQALRAIAVSSVMIYHLWPHWLSGGFVGVDVFFVISGFLITSHLMREIDSTGRLRPMRFWARRIKRLVPASSLVLLATTAGIVIWAPRYLWHQFLTEVVASVLQAQNWVLANNSVDYLAANNPPSPTQHFWTLAVEEQFYVGLPLLLLAAACVKWGAAARRRQAIRLGLLVVLVASLAYSIMLTKTDSGLAYFSTFTRAWEFAVGALLACAPGRRTAAQLSRAGATRIVSPRRALLPWLGIAAIVGACVAYDGSTPFPGYTAALPVLGAALVIATGTGTTVASVGAFAPVALLGRVSYAAYLWHWPILVLMPFATGHPLTTHDRLAIVVASIAIAWVSTRFIEDPIRFNPRLLGRRRPGVVFAWALLPILLVSSFALTALHRETQRQKHAAAASRSVLNGNTRCLGAQALDPALSPCTNPALGGDLLPDPARAAADDANQPACWASVGPTPNVCTLGATQGYAKKILAVGDSHNVTLIDVYRTLATTHHWRVDVAGHGGCYLTTAVQPQPTSGGVGDCIAWRAAITRIARAGHYDAIIVTHSDRDRLVEAASGKTVARTTVDGLVAAWNQLPDVPIVAIRDNPSVPDDNLSCVETHEDTAAQHCSVPRGKAVLFDGQTEAAVQVPRATVIDLTSLYCSATTCSPVVGHVLVYRDHSHLTRTYTHTIAPYMNAEIVAALR